jgi:hypothetical protein
MAERLKENQIDETGVNPFNAPIPGESLTDSPDTPKAWERPPQYTDEEDAMRAVYMVLTEQDSLRGLIEIISEGVPLDEIAQVVLYKGYVEGKYTPDLMLLLAEPTIYLLIAIADYAQIKDYVLYEGEDDDPDAMIPDDSITPVNIDEDDESNEPEVQAKPSKESISDSLLSRIEKDLPSKVEEVVNVKKEEVE